MSYNIDKRLLDLTPYQTLEGNYPVRLDVNESFLNLPMRLTDAFSEEIKYLQFNRYPDPYAEKLCNAFGAYYGVDGGLVIAGNGSDELISLIIQGFLSDSDKVLTLSPDFSMYAFYTKLRQGSVVTLNKKDGYYIDLDEVLEEIHNQKPRIVIFSNPCNPTGGIVKSKEILSFVEKAPCLVIIDEAYMDFSDESVIDKVSKYDNLIVLRTLSKLGAAAAIRCGFAVSNPKITKVLKSIKSVYNLNSLTQIMARLIYQDKDFLRQSKDIILGSKEYLFNELSAIDKVMGKDFTVMPSSSNFIYIKTQMNKEIYSGLLQKGIAVRCFKDALRINAGSEYENTQLLYALRGLN